MTTLRDQLSQALVQAAADAGIELPPEISLAAVPSQDPRFGDYQCNAAMALAKATRQNPRAVAQQLVDHLDLADLCPPPTLAGPGFINFQIADAALAAHSHALLSEPKLAIPQANPPRTIILDFSAPNVAKPMHVGHIRSTIIGDALARIARALGHRVITDNHVGDWGTQFGMILYGWKNFLDEAALTQDPVAELVRIYRTVNSLQQEDEAVATTCREELVKLQAGDPDNLAIWRRCVDLSLDGLRQIYARLGISFDLYNGESFYNDRLAPLVEDMLARGLASVSEGAVCVFSDASCPPEEDPFLIHRDGEWLPAPAIIRKGDGGFLYATTDLATIDHRVEELGADAIWYVVGAPQSAHFNQVFAASRRRGHSVELTHIAHGSILGKDGKLMKTRSGENVQLADVLEEAVARAAKVLAEKGSELSQEERAQVAETIGISAVKYAELSQFRMTDYTFDWDTMLALHGNTAPYLIYSYVRSRSIFRKLEASPDFSAPLSISHPAERILALKIAQFAELVPECLANFRPNLLANYLYDLARSYHAFFEQCPVLKSEGDTRRSRLALCQLSAQTLRTGLDLLGIEVVERM